MKIVIFLCWDYTNHTLMYFFSDCIDWASSNGMGKVPHSTCKFFKGKGSWSMRCCACKSVPNAGAYVVSKVNTYILCCFVLLTLMKSSWKSILYKTNAFLPIVLIFCFSPYSFYIHHSVFTSCDKSSWRLDSFSQIDTTTYPLLTLFKLLKVKPFQNVC